MLVFQSRCADLMRQKNQARVLCFRLPILPTLWMCNSPRVSLIPPLRSELEARF